MIEDILHPRDAADLAEAIRSARDRGSPVEIVGAGTKRGIGRPVRSERVIALERFCGIGPYEPEELVVTAAAGTPVSVVEEALARCRQRLAFEPPDFGPLLGNPGAQTLGGVIGARLAGPARLGVGSVRDHLLGFTAVNGLGEVFKAGGRVVKNVTGFDLSKLICGSWGTLAVVTEATFRVVPVPELTITLVCRGLDAEAAVAMMGDAAGSSFAVAAAAWVPPSYAPVIGLEEGGSATLLRLEGPAPSVEYRYGALAQRLPGHAQRIDAEASGVIWRAVRDAAMMGSCTGSIWRVSVPPNRGGAVLAAFPEAEGVLDWAGGLVWLGFPKDWSGAPMRVHQIAGRYGGVAMLVRGDLATRIGVAGFPPLSGTARVLMRRVKASFDPDGILNPGRLDPEF